MSEIEIVYMHGKSLKITCLYSEVLFHLRDIIASAADCGIVHQYITWYCLPGAGFRPHVQCCTVAMTSTISVFRDIATSELYNSVLCSHVQLHKQGQANSCMVLVQNRWTHKADPDLHYSITSYTCASG